MKNRYVLMTLGFLGLIWISYLSFDLLKIDTRPNFLSYFEESDQRVIVIHDWGEIDRNTDNIVLPPTNEAVINSLANKLNSASYFVSASRPVIVIERKERWNKTNVEALFKNGIYPFKRKGLHQFSFGKFTGEYAKNQLILHACDISQNRNVFQADRKATYSIISYLTGGVEVCDVFKKSNSTYFYRKTKIGANAFKKHEDKKLFASIIPDKFDTYSFFDKNYLASIEPAFNKSPFLALMNHGVVILRSNNQSVAIFDFNEGQSPIQNLNERLSKTELNEEFASYDNIQFSSLINQGTNDQIHVAESDGFCLVSHNKDFLDEVLTEIKMGHSLSQNEEKLARIYNELPKKVTARIIDSTQTKAISIIGHNSHAISFVKNDSPQKNEAKKDRDYFAMNPGEKVIDFAVFNERGNVIALTESNKLVGYINGLRKWEKQLVGEIEILSGSQDRKYACVFNKNECQLMDIYGKIQFRFLSAKNVAPVMFTNKSKDEFLVASSVNNFSIINSQGTTIKQFSCSGNIKEMVIHNTKAMVLTNSTLYTLDLAKRKSILKITVDSLYHLTKDQSGMHAVSYQKGNLLTIDAQGKKSTVAVGNFSNDYTVVSNSSGMSILFKNQRTISLFDLTGKRRWQKSFQLNEISEIAAAENSSGKMTIILLDGIENELYLLNESGELMDTSSKHGEQKIELSRFGSRGFSITTFLGNYLIQYNK